MDLRKTLARDVRPFSDPGCRGDRFAFKCLLLVIDLVPHRDPRILRQHLFGRRVPPMCDRDVLYPTEIGDIVDMSLLVDVPGGNAKRM